MKKFFFIFLSSFFLLPSSLLAREMLDYQFVRLRALEKITARTVTFEAEVGKTLRFGGLYIKVQACRKAPPVEQPESAAFLQVWEDSNKDAADEAERESRWVFSGWMFASSPALSTMDHPIYDVWVLDCLQEKAPEPQVNPGERPGEGELGEGEVPQSPDIQRDILSP